MTDQEIRARMQKAVDHKLSGVQDDPWLAQRVMNRAEEEEPVVKKKLPLSVVFVLVGILLVGTALAAALHTDFFNRVFGGETRKDVAEHVEVINNGKGGLESLFPRREYVTMDAETAERLIGAQVMSEPVTVQMNHHTLTIISAVRDENALVMEMTLENPEGENALVFSQLLNEEKGAYFADDADIFFSVERAAEMMWVDMEGSTDTCVHLYYYCVFFDDLPEGEAPVLTAIYADQPLSAVTDDSRNHVVGTPIPVEHAVRTMAFAAEGGEAIELSPFSMKVTLMPADNERGAVVAIGSEQQMIVVPDPDSLARIDIVFEDGSTYTVIDRDGNIDNTVYLCSGLGADAMDTRIVLNRLVEPEKAARILINGIAYSRTD